MSRPWLKFGLPVLLLVGLAGGWAAQQQWRQRAEQARGEALFRGALPLAGRIVGHTMALPAGVSRCVNCHETRSTAISAAASAAAGDATGRYGPALDQRALATPRPRRGGPPSRYDATALCTLLRDGVDPAQVMIPQTMPRYIITGADCAALWRYLTSR